MIGKNDLPGDAASLADDIAARAGMPPQSDLEHSMHEISDQITRSAQAAAEQSREWVEQTHDSAAQTASSLRDRVSDTFEKKRDQVRGTVDDLRERATDAYEDARDWASERYDHHRERAYDLADRGYDRVVRVRSSTESFVADNPLLVGVVGLAAGLLLGAMLPRTRQERQTIGPWADEVRDQGLRYARDAARQSRAFVERALDPDNLDEAVRRADEAHRYEGPERTAHRL